MKNKQTMAVLLAMTMTGLSLAGCAQSSDSGAAESSAEETTESADENVSGETTEAAAETSSDEASSEVSEETDPEADEFIPADFVQERAGVDEFDDYTDVIGYLQGENEGYAYLSIDGSVGYILAVTDEMYTMEDGTNAATGVSLYGFNDDGKLVNIGNAYTNTTDDQYPIRCEDGVLYAADNYSYNEMKIRDDYDSLYISRMIMVSDDGESLTGFVREDGEYDDSSEDIGISKIDEYNDLLQSAEEKAPINFQKAEYDSYDAVIDNLQSGSGYAYIQINGYDGDILAVADSTYKWDNDENVSITVYLYAQDGDKVEILGNVLTGGTAYPVRCQDGILYDCNMKSYAETEVQQNTEGKYVLHHTKRASISYASDGTATVETEGDITAETEDDVYDLLSSMSDLSVINFELVK